MASKIASKIANVFAASRFVLPEQRELYLQIKGDDNNATDVVEFKFVDVDGSQTYNNADILLSATDTGATTAINFAADGSYKLKNASSVEIAIIASPTLVKDASGAINGLKGDKEITVM
ncbi:hypothetical protein [Brevibacillus choshinensis]|uniref:hypothetical protein n=1 Tax=Brevibacillus choshinensis TaxID=54911 RepID=UPI002E22C828|nr:hypothetical protein [Brevibacillus choshinensis]